MNSVILTGTQPTAVLSGSMTAFWTLVKPQPPTPEHTLWTATEGKIKGKSFWIKGERYNESEGFIAPYRVGQRVYVREQVWYNEVPDAYYYKAAGYCEEEMKTALQWGLKWRSAATMPREAARIWLEITGVECVRVQEVTEEQLECMNAIYTCYECNGYGYREMGGDIVDCRNKLCGLSDSDLNELKISFTEKHSQQLWGANPYIFINEFKLVTV